MITKLLNVNQCEMRTGNDGITMERCAFHCKCQCCIVTDRQLNIYVFIWDICRQLYVVNIESEWEREK